MEISINLDNKVVYDKEFSKVNILKATGKVLIIASGIILTKGTLSYAATIPKEFFKGEATQGTLYIILRLIEVINHSEICESFEWYDSIATGFFKFLGKASIEAIKEIPVEVLPTLIPYRLY